MKRVCVFCGSSPGARSEYATATRRLGRVLVDRKLGLVYGGGNVGLMGEIADAVLHESGEVIGVIPRALVDKELGHGGVSDLRIVDSMHERKALMFDLSDGFITLPGGMGTLEEYFEVLTWAQLGVHGKPCGLLNVCDYYRTLIEFLDHAVAQRFLKNHHRQMVLIEKDPEALIEKLEAYQAPRIEKWIDRKST